MIKICEYCEEEFNDKRKYCSDDCMWEMNSLKSAARYHENKDYREKLLGKVHEHHLKRRYGISKEEYIKMSDAQNNRCAVCGVHQVELDKNLAVDHDHNTGKVRGLLCLHCNTGIGNLRDSIDLLKKAQKYLEETGE